MSLTVSVAPTQPQISVVVGGQSSISASQSPGGVISFGSNAVVIQPVSPEVPAQKPRGMALLRSTKSSGSISVSGLTTSGYMTVLWWDGVVQVAGPFNGTTPITASRPVPATGSWSGASPKPIHVWSGNRAQVGDITSLNCVSGGLFAIDVTDCDRLSLLNVANNSLHSLSVQSPVLASLYCNGNELTELNVARFTGLKELYCHSNLLTSLSLSANTGLEVLQCNNNFLTSLSLAGLSLLSGLYCHNNQLAAIDLRPCPQIKNVNCGGNKLTSIRATGLAINGATGASLSHNLLAGSALDLFYQDLLPTVEGKIYVGGNPGANSDNPAIATAKGYTVYGT